MCGFAGLISFKDSKDSKDNIDNVLDMMGNSIQHRGPDGSGKWISNCRNIGMIHKRLSIIDLKKEANQPMVDDSERYIIVFNGEIYNYLELRNEIGVKNFRTNSDTEVILKSFIKWGENCVDHLRGMFSFVIWDKKEMEFYIARDRFGIKPFYWLKNDNGFYFASEMKALIPFLEKKEVNNLALSDYFTYQFTVKIKLFLKVYLNFQLQAIHFFPLKRT